MSPGAEISLGAVLFIISWLFWIVLVIVIDRIKAKYEFY